jgi:hypothetical protein
MLGRPEAGTGDGDGDGDGGKCRSILHDDRSIQQLPNYVVSF